MDFFSFDTSWQDSTLYVLLSASTYFSLLLLTSLRVIIKRRPSGISLAWLFLIYALPLLGMVSYFIFGELHLGKKRQKRREQMGDRFHHWLHTESAENRQSKEGISPCARSMQAFVESYTSIPMLKGNQHTLLSSTDQILLELTQQIDQAQSHCYLLFYICSEGGLVDNLLDALIKASERGVQCKLLLDSVGSHDFFKSELPFIMRRAGIEVGEALPVGAFRLLFQRQDLRMHRKLVCIDDHVAYTGSMNLVDPAYFKKGHGVGEWIDIMVRCEGPIVQLMQGLFIWDWYLETSNKMALPLSQIELPLSKIARFPIIGAQNSQLIPSGPEFGKASIHQVLLSAIYEAKFSLVLTTPYFVPDESILEALQVAALRGVDVKIILPAKNDSFMVKYASRAFFDELLTAGVKIYKFHGGLLHSKTIVIDEKIALLGTVNLDRRSFWLNFEMTMLIDNDQFAGELLTIQMHYLLESDQFLLADWRKRSYLKKLLESTLYLFSPLL
ncbi:MAG: cardiolipin synthase [Psychromonas sp.]|jgi:cardiolipin synthase|uniref:cardiolipin synthase n=1 Tax=Psychromonas sp. TaxID=1884585 RepID=UPI0039E68AD2